MPINRGYNIHASEPNRRRDKPIEEQYCFPGMFKGLLTENQVALALDTVFETKNEKYGWYRKQQNIAYYNMIGIAAPLIFSSETPSYEYAVANKRLGMLETDAAVIVFTIAPTKTSSTTGTRTYNRMGITLNGSWSYVKNAVHECSENNKVNMHVVATSFWEVTHEMYKPVLEWETITGELEWGTTPGELERGTTSSELEWGTTPGKLVRGLATYGVMVRTSVTGREPSLFGSSTSATGAREDKWHRVAAYKVRELMNAYTGRHEQALGTFMMKLQDVLRLGFVSINGMYKNDTS